MPEEKRQGTNRTYKNTLIYKRNLYGIHNNEVHKLNKLYKNVRKHK